MQGSQTLTLSAYICMKLVVLLTIKLGAHMSEAGHWCCHRCFLVQVGSPIKTCSVSYSHGQKRLVTCTWSVSICFLSLPSVATGGRGALFTLLSTFAFFDGGFPCSRRKKQRQRENAIWPISVYGYKKIQLVGEGVDVPILKAEKNALSLSEFKIDASFLCQNTCPSRI